MPRPRPICRRAHTSIACWRIPTRSICSATTHGWIPRRGYNEEETKVIRELRKIMRGAGAAHRRDVRARAGAAGTFDRAHRRVRTADRAGRWRAKFSPPRRACASSTMPRAITSRCRSRRPDRTTYWSGAFRRDASDPSGCSLALFVAGRSVAEGRRAQCRADCRKARCVATLLRDGRIWPAIAEALTL